MSRAADATKNEAALSPARDSILTRDEVARWLKVKPRQIERLGVPVLNLGAKTKRYLGRDVLDWLDGQLRKAARRT